MLSVIYLGIAQNPTYCYPRICNFQLIIPWCTWVIVLQYTEYLKLVVPIDVCVLLWNTLINTYTLTLLMLWEMQLNLTRVMQHVFWNMYSTVHTFYVLHLSHFTSIQNGLSCKAALEFSTDDFASDWFLLFSVGDSYRPYIVLLAVSTHPPAGDLSRCTLCCLGPAGLCPPYSVGPCRPLSEDCAARSIVSALRASVRRIYRAWPLRAPVRSFISIRQVAPNLSRFALELVAFYHTLWPRHSPNVHLVPRSVICHSRSHCLKSAPGRRKLDRVGQLLKNCSEDVSVWSFCRLKFRCAHL